MLHDIKKIFRSIRIAVKGLCHAYASDKSFRMEINYGLPIYIALGWYLSPFQAWEFLLYVFSYLLILIIELVNTAFETMLERLHPEQHETIGKSKDIASGAVLLSLIFAAFVVATLLYIRTFHGPNVAVDVFFA